MATRSAIAKPISSPSEQTIVTPEIENGNLQFRSEIETVTLTMDRARELARALLSVVEAIEFVAHQKSLLDRKLHSLSRGIESSIPPFNRRSPNWATTSRKIRA